jgi:non-ribosomal peptide synthetase component F/thioesterase domain-containing protein/acyl carrier protein
MQTTPSNTPELAAPAASEDVFVFPVTVAQRRFWMLDQLKPGNPGLNIPLGARLQGKVDRAILERTFNEIICRHEILRTSFRTVDGELMQVVHPIRTTVLGWDDLSHLSEAEREPEIERLRQIEALKPFSLTSDPLLRASLIKVQEDDYLLNFSMHHIACDGVSMGVLVSEIARFYTALATGEPLPPELPLQYADFAHWQNEWISSPAAAKEREHWLSQLHGTLPVLNLPTDRPRRAGRTHPGTIETLLLPKSLTDQLRKFCVQEDVTLFMLLITMYAEVLYRYTGNPDVVLGSPAANRNQTDLEGLIGLFTNPLLMRLDFSGNPSLRTLLGRVKTQSLEAFANQSYPFEKLVEEIHTDPHRTGIQWLQAYFVFQKAFMQPQQMGGIAWTPIRSISPGAMFEWLLGVVERAEGVRLQLEYNTDLFDRETIERALHHFRRVLEAFLTNPDVGVGDVDILTPTERQELLNWRTTELEIPQVSTVCELFEELVRKSPGATAVSDGKLNVSYAQLDREANQLAHYLRGAGLPPQSRIGLAVPLTSNAFVTGLLAILKAGSGCVVLDPIQGAQQLSALAKELKLTTLLLESDSPLLQLPTEVRLVRLDRDRTAISNQPGTDLPLAATSDSTAWLRFTAGRSGTPRAVVISHRALLHAAWIKAHQFGLNQSDRVTGSMDDILPTLLSGACWVAPPRLPVFTAEAWQQWAGAAGVTIAAIPTPQWHEWVHQCASGHTSPDGQLRLIAVGGENLSPAALTAWQQLTKNKIRVLDCYQLAETAGPVAYTDPFATRQTHGRVTINRPAPNTSLHILDANLQPVPTGVPGDIYAGGATVAAGYDSPSSAAAAAFIPNPWKPGAGERLVKTGDRGRLVAGEGIELTGRIEELAKTHGFRLELCELRWILCQHPAIWDAVLEPREDGEKTLVAHVTAAPAAILESDEVLHFLRERLPAYMVPDAVLVWDKFPLRADGLMDRAALRARNAEPIVQNGSTHLNSAENTIAKLWREALQVKHVGRDDNFFSFGGDSLAAARLQMRIEQTLGKRLPLAAFFRSPTIAQQAALLTEPETSAPASRAVAAFTGNSAAKYAPLFVFHFLSMAQALGKELWPDCLVYGIESRLDEKFPAWQKTGQPGITLEELAAEGIRDMRAVQPEGPYNLAGFCFGGTLAFEVANQLTQQGEKVHVLALVSARNGRGMKPSTAPWLGFWPYHARQFLKHGLSYLRLKQQYRSAKSLVVQPRSDHNGEGTPIWDKEELRLLQSGLTSQVIRNYQAVPIPVRTIVYRPVADPQPTKWKYDPYCGWKELVTGELHAKEMFCSHSDMPHPPFIAEVAKHLRMYMG